MSGKPNTKWKETMLRRLNGDEKALHLHMADIGKLGGSKTGHKGFALNPALASIAGKKAGKISKRGYKYIETKDGYNYYIALVTGNVVKYKHEDRT